MTIAATKQFCTFFVGGHYFGVPVLDVQEAIRYQEMTSVPLSSSVVSGLINLRGQIVVAFDLRRRLELPPRSDGAKPMNVVVRHLDGVVSLLVDEIDDVVETDEVTFEPAPATLKGVAREVILGAYKLKNRLLLVLDIEKVLSIEAITSGDGDDNAS